MTDDPPPQPPQPPELPLGSEPEQPVEVDRADAPRRPLGRDLVLGAVAFVATLILLFGIANLIRPSAGSGVIAASPSGPAAASSSVPSQPAASPSPSNAVASPPTLEPSSPGASPSPSGAQPSPSTSPTPGDDPVLIGAGDIADCTHDGDSATAALVEANPGTVFTAGDNAYQDGSPDQFRDCYGPTWGRFLDRTRPSAGNHDWVTKDLAGYLGYFGAAAAPNGTSWYSYDLGAWHIVVLDSNCTSVGGCGPDSAQGRWLADDLTASSARCALAIWHHPRFSSGEHGNDESVAPFWRALYDAGADLVVNGHDHDYERFAPQDPDGREDRERGIRAFVVGTGGALLREFSAIAPNSELRATGSYGVIRLVLHPTSYDWRFIPTTGNFSDSGQGPCH